LHSFWVWQNKFGLSLLKIRSYPGKAGASRLFLSDESDVTLPIYRMQLSVLKLNAMDNPYGGAVIQPGLKLPGLDNFVNHSRDRGVSYSRSDTLTGKVNGAVNQY